MDILKQARLKLKEQEAQSQFEPKRFDLQEESEIPKIEKKPQKAEQFCPECNRSYKISQDKDRNKKELLKDIANNIIEKGNLLTLDFWRGQKFIYDNLLEMRKK